MSDILKCPFCNKTLQPTLRKSDEYWCENYDCPRTNIEWVGSQKLWQELIRTRKALEIAVDALKRLEKELYFNNAKQTGHIADSVMSIPSIALEQITALEQKDK